MVTVLWLQITYLLWQFVRGEKYCRVPYALVVHTSMWLIGKWSRPFAKRNYLVLETGREKFFVTDSGAEACQNSCICRTDRFRIEVSYPEEAPQLVVISIPAINFKLCTSKDRKHQTFLWNYLRDKPECLARVADSLLPNVAILDRVSDVEALRMLCQGDYIPGRRNERFLAMPDRKHELHPNFILLLSTVPLIAQARGNEGLSIWISAGVLVIDHLSLVFNFVWQKLKRFGFYVLTAPMTGSYFQAQTREVLCSILSTLSRKLKPSDQVRMNLIKVREGDVVYTMYPRFNLADFDKITVPEFTRKRKTPRPYSKEKFGVFTNLGDELEIEEGTPVVTHYIDGARIDSIFQDTGEFYNFRNNEALHLGIWKCSKDAKDCDESYNNLLDLMQIMEEMQMLPVRQMDDGRLRSVDFNMFVDPKRSLKDLTFLVAKRAFIIGG